MSQDLRLQQGNLQSWLGDSIVTYQSRDASLYKFKLRLILFPNLDSIVSELTTIQCPNRSLSASEQALNGWSWISFTIGKPLKLRLRCISDDTRENQGLSFGSYRQLKFSVPSLIFYPLLPYIPIIQNPVTTNYDDQSHRSSQQV